jgi:uncharacterized membrane protein HdeD (DUF308 family)
MAHLLAQNWWAFALRGTLAIAFGLVVFAFPRAALLSFVLLFAGYAIADGLFAMMAAVRAAGAGGRWGLYALEGAVGPVVGITALAWPRLTVLIFLTLVAAWALLIGCLMLTAAIRAGAHHGRWFLALGGLMSIAYGALMILAPKLGALVLTWWLGAYAMVFGITLLALAFRLRARHVDADSRRRAD